MATYGTMVNWMSVLLSQQLTQEQIGTLLNKADLEECENWTWARLKARTTVNSFAALTISPVVVTQNSTVISTTTQQFPVIPNNQYVVRVSGQTYSPINLVPNAQPSFQLNLVQPYPAVSATDASVTIFPLYYLVPGWQQVLSVNQQIPLGYFTEGEMLSMDPWLSELGSPAIKWFDAGRDSLTPASSDAARFGLWPIETAANAYVVLGVRGHIDMVNDADMPAIPSAVIVPKAMSEACESLYTLRGDQFWADQRIYYRQVYQEELEKARDRDRLQYGQLAAVQDSRPRIPGLDQIPYRDSGEWD